METSLSTTFALTAQTVRVKYMTIRTRFEQENNMYSACFRFKSFYGPKKKDFYYLPTFLYLKNKYSAIITQKTMSMSMTPNTDTPMTIAHASPHLAGEKIQ